VHRCPIIRSGKKDNTNVALLLLFYDYGNIIIIMRSVDVLHPNVVIVDVSGKPNASVFSDFRDFVLPESTPVLICI
jgi:hypothetical protein